MANRQERRARGQRGTVCAECGTKVKGPEPLRALVLAGELLIGHVECIDALAGELVALGLVWRDLG